MREILFRGKHTRTGEWVEGLLWKKKYNHNKLFISCFPDKDDNEEIYIIKPETIGQYTGLTDKNGIKIFEGDIVKCRHEWAGKNKDFCIDDLFTMSIPTDIEMQEEFEEQTIRNAYGKHTEEKSLRTHFYYYRNYVVEYYALNGGYRFRNGSDFHDMTAGYISNRNAEVIGNIHDNPELLKEREGK